jgi:hypothetical protein
MISESERRAKQRIEAEYIKYKPGETYIALEDLEFRWTMEQVKKIEQMWEEGLSWDYMADYFDRDKDEVAVILMCRARKGFINPRKQGIF